MAKGPIPIIKLCNKFAIRDTFVKIVLMKRKFSLWVFWVVGICVALGLSQQSFAQEESVVQTEERDILWRDLNDFSASLTIGCTSVGNHGTQCLEEGLSIESKKIQNRMNARGWKSPQVLNWVLAWMNAQNRHVLAHELPALNALVGEVQTVVFLRTQLPEDKVPPEESNLETLALQVMVVWKNRPLRQSHEFEHLLQAKYQNSVAGPRRYMLHWAAWMGHPQALDKIEQVATTYWGMSGLERMISFGHRQEFQHAAGALLEFASSDLALQERAHRLLQQIQGHSATPNAVVEMIKRSSRSKLPNCC